MIAYLATTLEKGRAIAQQQLALAIKHSRGRMCVFTDHFAAHFGAAPIGFIITRPEQIIGLELSGVVLLDRVDSWLLATALSRFRASVSGEGMNRVEPHLIPENTDP